MQHCCRHFTSNISVLLVWKRELGIPKLCPRKDLKVENKLIWILKRLQRKYIVPSVQSFTLYSFRSVDLHKWNGHKSITYQINLLDVLGTILQQWFLSWKKVFASLSCRRKYYSCSCLFDAYIQSSHDG